MKRLAILKNGYVINVALVDLEATPEWRPDIAHDQVVIDVNELVAIGDWYEHKEGIFYRPLLPSSAQENIVSGT